MVDFAPAAFQLKDGRTLTLRSLLADDFPAFVVFLRRIAVETTHTMRYPGQADPAPVSTTAGWIADRASPHSLGIAAFDGDRLVGMLRTRIDRPDHPMRAHAASFFMMMLKEVWGQGLGSQLLALQDEYVERSGVTRLEAGVRAQNPRALALYKKAGFTVEATYQKYAKVGGVYEAEYGIVKFYGDAVPAPVMLPTLATPRLVLRALTLADAPAIYQYGKDPEVSKHTLWSQHTDPRDARAYIRDYALARYAANELDPFGIALIDDPSQVIGTVGCFRARGDTGGRILELAYALARPYWGQGLVVEAARALVDYCWVSRPEVARIQAHCDAANSASTRVMEKLGMRCEGTARQNMMVKGALRDTTSYALLRVDRSKHHI